MAFSKRAIQIDNLSIPAEQTVDDQYLVVVFNQYYISIYRFVYRHIGDKETSKELASEVFKRLVKNTQRKKMYRAQISPWLYRTAHNLLIDYYRKQRHRNHLSLEEEIAGNSKLPPEIVDQRISETYVRNALASLTPEQRTVIVLKYLEGKSNHEVSEIMNKSVGAIKSLQHRALSALRRLLSEVMEG